MYLLLYYFVFFLLIFAYINIRLSVSTPDNCIVLNDNKGYKNIEQGTDINSTIKTANTYGVVTGGFFSNLWNTLKFASGFNTHDSCIGGFDFITAFLLTYIPAICLILAIVMIIWI
jgi:hypothetical protein